jgi:hypothetical protein
MRANLLHVFACYANPLRWRARLENFRRFEHHILAVGLPLTTVECAYGRCDWDLPDRPGVRRVRVRARDLLWQKENLLSLAAQHTPDWEYAATIDGDIHIVDPDWPINTLHALQLHKVAQISSELVLLGPSGQHIGKISSIMRLYLATFAEDCLTPLVSVYDARTPAPLVLKQHGYPGGAWAYRREAWDAIGGLMDRCIVGAADHHMAQALLELRQPGEPRGLSPAYDQYIDGWSMRARTAINRDVGLVQGLAVHYWHGKIADRKYQDRPRILERNQYDPIADVSYNSQGVLQLTGNKPKLRDDLRAYFSARNEDTVDM